jgi:integrase
MSSAPGPGPGDLVGKRDYALLLLYITTGMRRNGVMSLRGKEVIVEEKRIIIRGRVKGGDYQGREVTDRRVRAALLDYLRSGRRLHVLREDQPLWTRHDGAGELGAQLSSWSFVENLKRYAREAGIGKIHLHQTRHTFARMIAKRSGSLSETQDALGHRHASTTRIYVESIAVKTDKYGKHILEALELPDFEIDFSLDADADQERPKSTRTRIIKD